MSSFAKQESKNFNTDDIGIAVERAEVALAMVLEERFQRYSAALIKQYGPELTRRFLPKMTVFLLVTLAGYGVVYECSSLLITYVWPGAYGAVLALLSHGALFLSGVIFLLARRRRGVSSEPNGASKAHEAHSGIDQD
jgi:hypothetical protein